MTKIGKKHPKHFRRASRAYIYYKKTPKIFRRASRASIKTPKKIRRASRAYIKHLNNFFFAFGERGFFYKGIKN